MMHDGEIKYVPDETMEVPECTAVEQTQKMWDGCFWGLIRSKKTDVNRAHLSQKKGWFIRQHMDQFGLRPPTNMRLMPVEPMGWFKPLSKLRWSDLWGDLLPSGERVPMESDKFVISREKTLIQ